jgi:DNA-binding NarL/FixJ family response regulator
VDLLQSRVRLFGMWRDKPVAHVFRLETWEALLEQLEEVLNGVVRGQANKEIGSALNLSERTVKFRLSALLAKFCVPGRMELALMITRRTLGPMGEAQPFWTRCAEETK